MFYSQGDQECPKKFSKTRGNLDIFELIFLVPPQADSKNFVVKIWEIWEILSLVRAPAEPECLSCGNSKIMGHSQFSPFYRSFAMQWESQFFFFVNVITKNDKKSILIKISLRNFYSIFMKYTHSAFEMGKNDQK